MSNNIGKSTTSDRVRQAHRKFLKANPNLRTSLKQFVKENIERAKTNRDDSADHEKEWQLNKKGAKNEERTEKSQKRIFEEKLASKSSGKKK